MGFKPTDADELLVACHRRCCICHRYCGIKIELHHIEPRRGGGLREVFPNLAAIDHKSLIPVGGDINRPDHRERELIGLFNDFYAYVTGEDLTEEQKLFFPT
jgi:hypothetical protein